MRNQLEERVCIAIELKDKEIEEVTEQLTAEKEKAV